MHKLFTSIAGAALLVALLMFPGAALAKRGDRNHDRIPDRWERTHHLSLKVNQAARDQDRDGLKNLAEYRAHTDPRDADTDDDGTDDARDDNDRDGVDNADEVAEHTNPNAADTDRDGVDDGDEDSDHDGLRNGLEHATGHNPADADTDDDGVEDGAEQTGVVATFVNGLLTVTLADKTTISGQVTASTEISCGHQEDGHDDGDHHGDHHGAGEDDAKDASAQPTAACDATRLVAGVAIHEASIVTTSGGPVFKEIELVG